MYDFKSSLSAFSMPELMAAEGALGRPLPSSLVALLRKWNGGNPTKNTCRKDGDIYYFQHLFPISNWKQPNLRSEIEVSSYLTESGLVPFGIEGSGMVFAISEVGGSVHVCGRDGKRVFLAESLESFLNKLERPSQATRDERDERMNAIAGSVDPLLLRAYLRNGHSIEARNTDGLSLSQLCSVNGNVAMLEELRKAGATLNGALHYAARLNQRGVIAFLLEHGCSVLERDEKGLLPIDYVRANPPLRKYLLELSAERSEKEKGETKGS